MLSLRAPLAVLALAAMATAQEDPMSGMNMMGSTAPGQMLGYLHFAPLGDILWFPGWVPTRAGPMAGACVGLFLLAIFERWLAACRAVAERSWARSASMALADKLNHSTNRLPTSQDEKRPSITDTPSTLATLPTVPGRGQSPNLAIARTTPPFMPTNDISRALIHMTQSLLGFAFMLVVMTFQLGFIFSIVIGEGVGECLFGRYAMAM